MLCFTAKAEPPESILQLSSSSDRVALESQLKVLREQEKELAERSEKIKADYPSATALMETLADPKLPQTERDKIQTQLKVAVPELKRFQEDYDTLSNARYDFFLDLQVSLAKEVIKEGEGIFPAEEMKKYVDTLKEITASRDMYHERKGLFGQGKDTLRLTSVREVFDKTREILTKFAAYTNADAGKTPNGARKTSRLKSLLNIARVIPSAVPFAWELYRGERSAKYWEKNPGKAPLSDAMLGFFKAQGQIANFKVEVVGGQNLIKPKGPKDVVIYCPQHSNAFMDFVSASNLDLKGSAFFGAADNFHMGKWAADRFEASDSFVMVGRGGGKPLEKTKALIASGKINKFVLFPEGSLSGGLGETRPVRPGFITGFVEQLQKEGYSVSIVPISFPHSLRFDQTADDAGFAPKGEPKQLKAVVHAPLTPEGMKAIQDATGQASDAVYLLRQIFLEDGAAANERSPGLPPIDSLLTNMLTRWGVDDICIRNFEDVRAKNAQAGGGQQ